MIEQRFVERIATTLGVRPDQVAVAIQLLDKGATVPFIAAYRKDFTGGLTDALLEQIESYNIKYTAFVNRRQAIIENIAKRNMLTENLRQEIMACNLSAELEDIYLPFRRQRRTRATVAREQELGPLADYIWEQPDDAQSLEEVARSFMNSQKQISSPEEALDGARAILIERINFDRVTRGMIRERLFKEGQVTTGVTPHAEGQKTKFEAYYNFSEPLASIPSHRLLAALRGAKQGILRIELVIDDDRMMRDIVERFRKSERADTAEQIRAAVKEAYHRHLKPTLEEEVRAIAREDAETEAIRVFQENARNLLLSPPAGAIPVIGIEPDSEGGGMLAVVDATGSHTASAALKPQEDSAQAEKDLAGLIEQHHIKAVAIGNAQGARDIARFVKGIIRKSGNNQVFSILVNESGAAIYSASKIAREEFPDAELAVRSAISVARRLQDPLAELVKIEPRNIGVGQYQHDVNQRQLRDGLFKTIVSSVNRVTVDLNNADVSLLRYVSGIQMGTAQNLVAFRKQHNGFTNRRQLIDVDGIGPKTFEQCAGFLRIPNGDTPLDATAIHPEAYPVVERMASDLEVSAADLVRNRDLIEKIDFDKYQMDSIGPATLADIRAELLRPGRDPRRRFKPPKFLEGVYSVAELQEGMACEGIVTNVTDFGAFVDIGVQQDGLVHLSELANRYVPDPRQVVKVGDIVRVHVIQVDKETPRISLSMRAAAKAKRKRPPQRGKSEGVPREQAGTESKERGGGAPARADSRGSQGDRDQEKKRDTRRRERPPKRGRSDDSRRKDSAKGGSSNVKYGDKSSKGLNTQLADQLADLKKRFGE
ncbi:MAG: helix-hairpin-helix domain-containing protein [Candidatus Hydrogenedentota bacterium]